MRRILFAVLAAMLLGRCAGPAGDEGNVAIARKMFDAFNAHQWEAMAGYYSEPASFLDPSLGKAYVDQHRADVVRKYAELQQLFPDIQDDITGIYPSCDRVVVEFTSTGTMGDSVSFSLPIVTVLTFQDGHIVKDATYYDLENP
jgi:ketosteroid isomerase-like protein